MRLEVASDSGEAAVGVEAGGVVPCIGNCDNFVCAGGGDKTLQARGDSGIAADDGCAEFAFDSGAFPVCPESLHGVDGRKQFDGLIANEAQESLLGGGEEALRGGIGFGGENGYGDDEPRALEDVTGLKVSEVEACGVLKHLRGKVCREGEGKAERGGKASAVVAGAEQEDGHTAVLAGMGLDGLAGLLGAEVGSELGEEFGEVVAALAGVAA